MAKEITKLTRPQLDVFWGEFTRGEYRYKSDGSRARVTGGAFHRMMDNLRAAGLWGAGYGGKGDATPIALRHGPTAAGARLWLAQEKPALIHHEARAKAEARIVQWEQLNVENEARLLREREERAVQADAAREAARVRKLADLRAILADHGIADGWPDDDLLHFAERVAAL